MRLFLAFPPVPAWQQLQGELKPKLIDPRIRWTRPQNLHLTFYFIGEADPVQLDRLYASSEQVLSTAAPFELEPETIVTAGAPQHPTMLWLCYAVHPAFTDLHHRLHRALSGFSVSRGTVHASPVPHITLARFPKNTLDHLQQELAGGYHEKLSVEVCEVWQTTHDEAGVLYKRLKRFRIGG